MYFNVPTISSDKQNESQPAEGWDSSLSQIVGRLSPSPMQRAGLKGEGGGCILCGLAAIGKACRGMTAADLPQRSRGSLGSLSPW